MNVICYITATVSVQHCVLVKHNSTFSDCVVNNIKYISYSFTLRV